MRLSELQSKNIITTSGKLIGTIIDVVVEEGSIKSFIVEKNKFFVLTIHSHTYIIFGVRR